APVGGCGEGGGEPAEVGRRTRAARRSPHRGGPASVHERLGTRVCARTLGRCRDRTRRREPTFSVWLAPVKHVVILGAGFGGLELASRLSDSLADEVRVTLIDRNDSFTFGFSKLDILFGHNDAAAVRIPYRELAKPG